MSKTVKASKKSLTWGASLLKGILERHIERLCLKRMIEKMADIYSQAI